MKLKTVIHKIGRVVGHRIHTLEANHSNSSASFLKTQRALTQFFFQRKMPLEMP